VGGGEAKDWAKLRGVPIFELYGGPRRFPLYLWWFDVERKSKEADEAGDGQVRQLRTAFFVRRARGALDGMQMAEEVRMGQGGGMKG